MRCRRNIRRNCWRRFPVKAEPTTRPAPNVVGLLDDAAARIASALGLERREARLEAQVLASSALEVNRAWLIAHDQDVLTPPQAEAVETLVARRAQGEPVAYILGEREFYGRMFKVTPDVLIPRPETELLVELALARIPPNQVVDVLELGTGSGCIAISLALERPKARVTAVDRMEAALTVARENAQRLDATVEFLNSRWFAEIPGRRFDLIVCNPPYVASGDPHLLQGDVRHEPPSALAAGNEGLEDLREIVQSAQNHLHAGGNLLLEHGYDQADALRGLLEAKNFLGIQSWVDLSGIPRVSGAHVSE
jgi:release factor glutamine methyltransferase